MLVIRVYAVMDTTVVEVSCVGHEAQPDHPQGHLVARETLHRKGTPQDGIWLTSEVLQDLWAAAAERDVLWTDDCAL